MLKVSRWDHLEEGRKHKRSVEKRTNEEQAKPPLRQSLALKRDPGEIKDLRIGGRPRLSKGTQKPSSKRKIIRRGVAGGGICSQKEKITNQCRREGRNPCIAQARQSGWNKPATGEDEVLVPSPLSDEQSDGMQKSAQ